jgi:chaperonin GroES
MPEAVDFEPFHDRVLVRQDEAAGEEARPGGIVVPDNQKERPLEGRVMATGPGRHELGVFIPVACAVGDQVLFGQFAGTKVVVGGVEYLILRDEEILGRRMQKTGPSHDD